MFISENNSGCFYNLPKKHLWSISTLFFVTLCFCEYKKVTAQLNLCTEVKSGFDHIWNGPFSPCLPFLFLFSRKIIGFKTSVKSHSSFFFSWTPPWPHRPNPHNEAPLNLISASLDVVDREWRFSGPSYNSCGRSSHWPHRLLVDQFLYVSLSCGEIEPQFFQLYHCKNYAWGWTSFQPKVGTVSV